MGIGGSSRAGAESSMAWRSRQRERGIARESLPGTGGRCGEQVTLEGLQGQRCKGRHRQTSHISGSTSWAGSQRDKAAHSLCQQRCTTSFAVGKPAVFPGSVQVKSLRQPYAQEWLWVILLLSPSFIQRDYPRLHFLFLKQKIKQKQTKGEAFTTRSCYMAFRSVCVFITYLCCWQWGLPEETRTIAIRSGIAGDTLIGCLSFFCLVMMA